MTQQPAQAQTIADAALNWSTFRIILESDLRIYTDIAVTFAPSSTARARCQAKAEYAASLLESMTQLENRVPGLAEHTAAACDTITRAAR